MANRKTMELIYLCNGRRIKEANEERIHKRQELDRNIAPAQKSDLDWLV